MKVPLTADHAPPRWRPGSAPVAVVMISLNEGHNMEAVLENLSGWAQEVFLVDSYSRDETVEVALRHGVHVVQRRFRGFGDQWNFALETLPISARWTMKMDPDERISPELKREIEREVEDQSAEGFLVNIRLFFMERPLPVRLNLMRLWRTGRARFSDVAANEHAKVDGPVGRLTADIEHHDSPDLDHWFEKQNRYSTAEAIIAYTRSELAEQPFLLGSRLQRRMWLKKHFYSVPGRYLILFFYHFIVQGTWRAGWVGLTWSRLRVMVTRMIEYKRREIELTGRVPRGRCYGPGEPDSRVPQFD